MNAASLLEQPAVPVWSARTGVIGLYLFAGAAFLFTALAYLGLTLMLLAALAQWRWLWLALRRDPMLWLFAWSVLAVVASDGVAALERSGEVEAQVEAGFAVLRLWMFLLVAWWIQGRQSRLLMVLALAFAGYLLGTLRALDSAELQALMALERPSFRWSINAFAEYTGACLVGLAVLAPRLQRALRGSRWHWPALTALAVLASMLLLGVLMSQSRGVWLSLLVVVAGLLAYQFAVSPEQRPSRGVLLGAAALAGVTLALSLVLNPQVLGRMSFLYQPLVEQVRPGAAPPGMPDASIGERTGMLQFATERWLDRPWLGWGLGAAPFLLEQHRERRGDASIYKDFHNLALDLLVGLGVLGTLPLLLAVLLVLRAVWTAHRDALLDWDVHLLLLGLMVFNLLSQLTDTRILSLHGRFYWLLIAGAAYSCHLAMAAGRVTKPGPKP